MSEINEFTLRNSKFIHEMGNDEALKEVTKDWFVRSSKHEYSYHFSWLGRPIIQFPQDVLATQEIIWRVKPDLIIETGIAHGGSLIFYASMLELLGEAGQVLGVDIDIREHNRFEIESHPMFKRITMLQGSSINEEIAKQIHQIAADKRQVLVILDSNHTHNHVLKELELYAPLVTKGSYLIVFDTIIEDMPESFSSDRPWGQGNNPKTAVQEFLRDNDRFQTDQEIQAKLLITVAPNGYLKCVKD